MLSRVREIPTRNLHGEEGSTVRVRQRLSKNPRSRRRRSDGSNAHGSQISIPANASGNVSSLIRCSRGAAADRAPRGDQGPMSSRSSLMLLSVNSTRAGAGHGPASLADDSSSGSEPPAVDVSFPRSGLASPWAHPRNSPKGSRRR